MKRRLHQFIVSEMGSSLYDFSPETVFSVILPPDHDDSEMLTIVGPDRIEEVCEQIIDLASRMATANFGIARHHANAPWGAQAHARNVTRYLQRCEVNQELERLQNARIIPETSD